MITTKDTKNTKGRVRMEIRFLMIFIFFFFRVFRVFRGDLFLQQDVGRLQVAVDHAAVVGVLHGCGDLPDARRRLTGRQRRAIHPVCQTRPRDELHHEVVPAVVLAEGVDGDDTRVLQLASRLGLGPEPLYLGVARQGAGSKDLQGDDPVRALLPGPVDDTHAAAADLAEQLELAEPPARLVRAEEEFQDLLGLVKLPQLRRQVGEPVE
jgi:hypothetical protein